MLYHEVRTLLYLWYIKHLEVRTVSLVVDGPGFESQQRQQIFLFARNVETSSGAHPATYSVGTGGGRESDRVMRLTIHLSLVPSLHSLYTPSWRGQGHGDIKMVFSEISNGDTEGSHIFRPRGPYIRTLNMNYIELARFTPCTGPFTHNEELYALYSSSVFLILSPE